MRLIALVLFLLPAIVSAYSPTAVSTASVVQAINDNGDYFGCYGDLGTPEPVMIVDYECVPLTGLVACTVAGFVQNRTGVSRADVVCGGPPMTMPPESSLTGWRSDLLLVGRMPAFCSWSPSGKGFCQVLGEAVNCRVLYQMAGRRVIYLAHQCDRARGIRGNPA